MTYCLGILLPTGLVMASDSRSNAGVDRWRAEAHLPNSETHSQISQETSATNAYRQPK